MTAEDWRRFVDVGGLRQFEQQKRLDREEFYVCPQHTGTGGYESCCNCGGWEEGDPDYGRECTEAGRK